MTTQSLFITVDEIRELLDISRTYAYKLVKDLNNELASQGFIVVRGQTSRQYFNERLYGKVV